jgi:tRNA(adenine34) deaminase
LAAEDFAGPEGTPAAEPPESLSRTGTDDERWMRLALAEAMRAEARGEVPVGAVIVREGQVVATGHNLTHTSNDPSAHAEMVAIRRAADALGHWRLLDCTLYVTLEPCAMCSGAIVLSRIPRLVFGTEDPKAGMCGSLENLVQDRRLNHRVELERGVLRAECGELLRAFFRRRRAEAVRHASGPPPTAREPGRAPD